MLKIASLCAAAMVLVVSSAVFAANPIDTYFAVNINGDPTTDFTVGGISPSVTLIGNSAINMGGPVAIAGVFTTPSYSGTTLAEADVSRFGNDSDCGLLLQFDPVNLSGYFLSIDFHSLSGKFDITKIYGGAEEANLAGVAISNYSQDETYHMEFTYNNGLMTGNVYDSMDVLSGSISATDNSYTGSYSGILCVTNAPDASLITSGSFGNYNIVPEPATLFLLSIGVAGVVAKRKRR